MTSDVRELRRALDGAFGSGLDVTDESVQSVWSIGDVELAVAESLPKRRIPAAWRARQGNRGVPLLLVSPGQSGLRVLGPNGEERIHEVPIEALIDALESVRTMPRRQAAATLSDLLERRDRAGIPGVVIRGLLTRHVLERRLRRDHPDEWSQLSEAAGRVNPDGDWRQNFVSLGYETDELKERSHLLRFNERPVAVVLPLSDVGAFSRATDDGSLPEGLLIADCLREGVEWGLLAAPGRFRLFPARTSPGQSLEVTRTLEPGSYRFLCFFPDPEGTPHAAFGMYELFTIAGDSGAALPEPDATITATDAGLRLPTLVPTSRRWSSRTVAQNPTSWRSSCSSPAWGSRTSTGGSGAAIKARLP